MLEAKANSNLLSFIYDAINDRKQSSEYKDACIAYEYFCKKNVTIMQFEKYQVNLKH